MSHEVGTITLDLLVGGYGAKDNLGELAVAKGPEGNSAHNLQRLFDDRD